MHYCTPTWFQGREHRINYYVVCSGFHMLTKYFTNGSSGCCWRLWCSIVIRSQRTLAGQTFRQLFRMSASDYNPDLPSLCSGIFLYVTPRYISSGSSRTQRSRNVARIIALYTIAHSWVGVSRKHLQIQFCPTWCAQRRDKEAERILNKVYNYKELR